MSAPRTVPIDSVVQMSATADIQHLCPFAEEIDNGTATITWQAAGWTLELHSLREYLNTFHDREISHEDLTEEIRAELSSHLGISHVTVNTSWRTAGMGVKCISSLTRAAARQ